MVTGVGMGGCSPSSYLQARGALLSISVHAYKDNRYSKSGVSKQCLSYVSEKEM